MAFNAEEQHFFIELLEKFEEIEMLFEEVGFEDLDSYESDDETGVSDSDASTIIMLRDLIMQAKELTQDLSNT